MQTALVRQPRASATPRARRARPLILAFAGMGLATAVLVLLAQSDIHLFPARVAPPPAAAAPADAAIAASPAVTADVAVAPPAAAPKEVTQALPIGDQPVAAAANPDSEKPQPSRPNSTEATASSQPAPDIVQPAESSLRLVPPARKLPVAADAVRPAPLIPPADIPSTAIAAPAPASMPSPRQPLPLQTELAPDNGTSLLVPAPSAPPPVAPPHG